MYTPVQLTGWVESIFCRRHGTKTASTSSLSTQSYSFHAPTSSIFFQTCLNIPVFTSTSENTLLPGQEKTPTPLLYCCFNNANSSAGPGCLLGAPLSCVCTVKQ